MGFRSSDERFYITDDDVDGLRNLESRPGFAGQWGTPSGLTTAPATIVRPPVQLCRLENVVRQNGNLMVTYGAVSSPASKLDFYLQPQGSSDWTPLMSDQESDTGMNQPTAQLSIGLGAGASPTPYLVRRPFD